MSATELDDIVAAREQADYVTDINARLDVDEVPRASWLSIVNVGYALVQIVAEFLAELRAVVQVLASAQFLDYATGDGLTLFARSQYQIERSPAVSTIGVMRLTAVSGAPTYNITAGQLIVGQPGSTGQRYTNTTAGTLTPGSTLDLTWEALEAGADGNLAVGSTLELKTSLAGVSVTNPIYADSTWITTQGQDEESDARLLARCPARWNTLSAGGGEDSMIFWAMAIPTGYSSSPVARVKVYSNRSAGVLAGGACTVLIAGSAGALAGADVAAVTGNFTGATEDYPDEDHDKVPLGCVLTVATTTNNSISIVGTVYVKSSAGVSTDEVETLVESALAAYQADLDIGETLYRQDIESVIGGASPAAIRNVTLTQPTTYSATAQTYNQTAVFALTLTYTLVD